MKKKCIFFKNKMGTRKIRCRNCEYYKPSMKFSYFGYCGCPHELLQENELNLLRKLVLSDVQR